MEGKVSTENSSTTPLGIGATFTGTAIDTLKFAVINISVYADEASATDGLKYQLSSDGLTGWRDGDVFTISAANEKTFSFQPAKRFFRVVYVNGGVAQTVFDLQTILKKGNTKPSSHRVKDPVSGEDDAELVKGLITGQRPDGVFANVSLTQEEAMNVSNFLVEVARGNIPGMKSFAIPGRKDALSSVVLDDLTEIPGTTVTPEPGGIQLEVVSSSGSDTSAGTGIQTLEIYYLDSSGFEQNEMVTLNGGTPVLTVATDIDAVQWAHTKTVGSGGVAAGNISIQGVGGGLVFEYVKAGGNQSLSGRFKIPTGKKGYVIGWQCSGITKKIDIRLRATVERFDRSLISGVFLFQDILVLNDTSSGWIPFEVPLRMPAGAVVKMSAISSAAGGDAAGKYDILLIDD